jgi:hypothetical protein
VVLLSLTRAAYLAWFAGALLCLPFIKFNKSLLIWLFGLLVLMPSFILLLGGDSLFITQILDRFNQYLFSSNVIESDISANTRIQIWTELFKIIFNDPLSMLIGNGQLGPSYFPIGITDLSGEFTDSTSAHSQYIDSIFRVGFIGVILEMSLLYIVCIKSRIHIRLDIIIKIMASATGIPMIFGFFNETLRWPVFSNLFWFTAGLVSINTNILKNVRTS